MNFMKRAWKSTKVKWGRSLLLFAVFTAILIFVLAGLTIRSAAEEAANQAQKEVGATVTLSANREASFKNRNKLLQAVLPLKNVQIQAVFLLHQFP